MRRTDTSDLWWKNAVVYCVDVESFVDSDGDGCGDLPGLTSRIDYLADLGVTCLWLMPFYPSPRRDDGYDITDFYAVHPQLGTLGDFVELVRAANHRGIRVITDLVLNHTSDEHPWFRSARASRDSPYRDFYVWRDEPPPDAPTDLVFPGDETSIWAFDDEAGQYYLHRFFRFQPDLNVANPAVREELARIAGFWMALGLAGFRVDAVPFFLETIDAMERAELPDPHQWLADLRAFLGRRHGEVVLLGEVNLPHVEQQRYFGTGQPELTMMFDFIGMQALYLALARQDASPLLRALGDRPPVRPESQWATFVRNHDELTLDKLTLPERREVFKAFGPRPDMQVYGRGLRRRLPPMLDGDPERIRMVYSLLFSLPGTPVLFYGEEIGMGENLAEPERLAVRTPMQWAPGRTAGFSTADPATWRSRPPRGRFGPARVNVEDQRRDPDSLLSFVRHLVHVYRSAPELGWGTFAPLDTDEKAVLGHRVAWEDRTVVAVHNLGDRPVTVSLAAGLGGRRTLTDLLGTDDAVTARDGSLEVALPRYGYRWLRA